MKKKLMFKILSTLSIIFVISFSVKSQTINVSTEEQLLDAIDNPSIHTINITANINLSNSPESGLQITRNLTINGASPTNKATINAGGNRRIFNSQTANVTFTINNLILTGGNYSQEGGALYINNIKLFANNCEFLNNSATYGGGISVSLNAFFIADKCIFYNNSATYWGGAVYVNSGYFAATNSTFVGNRANSGGVFCLDHAMTCIYLYHCTMDGNTASVRGGAGFIVNIPEFFSGNLYPYNCIFTGSTPNHIVHEYKGSMFYENDNLMDAVLETNRSLVFGTNQFNSALGYIVPLPYAAKAERLTANYIKVPILTNANEILSKLNTDQAGKPRPYSTNKTVTFGTIEVYRPMCNLTVNTTTGGTTDPYGISEKDSNTTILLTATPTSCYTFKHWVDRNNVEVSTNRNLNVRIIRDTLLTAVFEQKKFRFEVHSDGNGKTNINGLSTRGCDTTVTVTATPDNSCYVFKGWANSKNVIVSANNPLNVKITNDTLLKAVFEQIKYNLTIISDNNSLGTVSPSGTNSVNCDTTITITAKPVSSANDCYVFKYWINEYSQVVSIDNPLDINIKQNTTLIAVFERKEFAVSIFATPSYMGHISGGTTGTYICEINLILEAESYDVQEYEFLNWTDDNGNIISTNPYINIVIIKDTVLIANFVPVEIDSGGFVENYDIYDISVVPNPAKNDFNIVFDNTEEQRVSISLMDLSGRNVLDIFDGIMPPDRQIYNIDANLPNGTYFIKFVINDNIVFRNVVISR